MRLAFLLPVVAISLASMTSFAQAQQLDIDANIMKTMGDVASAVPSFTDAESAVQTTVGGNKPSKPVNFSQLAAQTRQLEEDIKKTPVAPFDDWDKNYQVSLGELTNCVTYPGALSKLKASSANLDSKIADAEAKLKKIDEAVKQAYATNDAAKFLEANMNAVLPLPWYGSIFLGDWMDLEGKLVPATGGVITALTKYRSDFVASIDKAKQQSSNLKENLNNFHNPMAGSYSTRQPFAGGADFGGGGYYRYHVDLSNVRMVVVIDNNGVISANSLDGRMAERVMNGHVGVIPANDHHFNSTGGNVSSNNVYLNWTGASSNSPKSAASFIGNITSGCDAINGTVRITRVDIGAPLKWTVIVPVTLRR